jgi:uncharacterized membrane protein
MRPRGLWIALGFSLVINVFLIGAAAGVIFSRALAPAAGAVQRQNPLMAAADRLDPTDRDAFRALMQDEVQHEGPTLLDSRMARRQAVALMQAPTFDRAAAGAAMDRARADDLEARQAIENAMLDFAAKLDAHGRTVLSEGVSRGAIRLPLRAGFGSAAAQPTAPPKQP